MQLSHLARFLVGDREAILALAADRRLLPVGLVLVLSAAVGRRYDQVHFLSEPQALFLPLVISGVNATLLWATLWLFLRPREDRPSAFESWRVTVGLFWLTAPLAWLYAIPWERMLGPEGAVRANLATLVLVAGWRVALTARAVAVALGLGFWRAFAVVLLFADAVAVVLAYLSPKPIWEVMGGVILAPGDALLLEATLLTILFGTLAFPVLLLGGYLASCRRQSSWSVPETAPAPFSRATAAGLALCLLAWAPLLPGPQREQANAAEVDALLAQGEAGAAVERMNRLGRAAFPPHFDPRPRDWPGERSPPLARVVERLLDHPEPAPWLVEIYALKLVREQWLRIEETDLKVYRRFVTGLPADSPLKPILLEDLERATSKLQSGWRRGVARPAGRRSVPPCSP